MQKILANSIFSMFLLFQLGVQAQDLGADLELIKGQNARANTFVHDHEPRFLLPKSNNIIVKFNPLSLIAGGALYVYQGVVSPQIGAQCLYDPTCSNFSREAIGHHGLIKGVFLSADRLTRCTRLATVDIIEVRVDPETNKVIDPVEFYKLKQHETH